MDYEQKYEEALERANDILKGYNPKEGSKATINYIFPELAESEDEKTRKALISFLKSPFVNENITDEKVAPWLAWLEKQKPEVNVVKFKPGNKVTNGISVYTIDSIEGDYYRTKDGINIPFNLEYRWKIVENEQNNIEGLTEFEKAFQGMCCDKNKQFAKECCKTLLELAKKQLQEKCDKQCCGEVNDIAMQQQLQIWFDKGKCSGRDEVIFHPETYGLQKQGEHKPADKVKPKFKVGDWLASDYNNVAYIESISETKYNLQCKDGYHEKISIDYIDRCWHLWTIQDAKPGDVLAFSYASQNYILVYKGLYEKKFETLMSVFCYYNVEEGTYYNETDNFHVMNSGEIITPATKEQRDTFFQKMHEAGYEWDAENKELNKIDDEEYNGEDYGIDSLYHAQRILEKTLGKVEGYQTDDGILSHQCAITAVKKLYEQKPTECIKFNNEFENQVSNLLASVLNREHEYNEGFVKYVAQSLLGYAKNELKPVEWSEEDEHRINRISDFIWKNRKGDTDEIYQQEQDVNWFKSLRPQPHWKPSQEQMYMLEWLTTNVLDDGVVGNKAKEVLNTLIEQLKSLKQRNTWKPSKEQMIALRQAISGCSYDIEPLLELEAKLKEF